jgi:hypothetical protein
MKQTKKPDGQIRLVKGDNDDSNEISLWLFYHEAEKETP